MIRIKIRRFLRSIAAIFTGLSMGSMWFTESDDWKIYILIALLAITLYMHYDEDK